jgi:glycosyltransferase involved in cell wall biosynthesis
MLDKANAVIVLSQSWLRIMRKYSSNPRMYVLHNTASQKDLISVKPAVQEDRILVLFVGRLTKAKGAYDLLEVIPTIIERHPNARFRMAGDGDFEQVEELIETKNLRDHVEILGWVSGQDKSAEFMRADIYVLPSYTEGMPGSLLEAMACGLPIVATTVGGIPETVVEEKNGYLIEAGDFAALTDRLMKLCADKELRQRLGEESLRIYNQRFGTEGILQQLLGIYQDVVAGA